MALYWSRMGDEAKARSWLDAAEAAIYGAQPASRSFVERNRGLLALRRGDAAEARRHLVAADRLYPGHWANLYFLAMALASDGDVDRALILLERLGERRRIPEAMDSAAILHRMRGERQASALWAGRAEAVWQDRMLLFPEAAAGHRLDHLLTFGAPAEALKVAALAYRARPFAESRIGLAWALIANNRPADALAALAPVRRSHWSSAELHLAAARALALLGRGKEAQAEQRAAEAINPNLADLRFPQLLVEH
jgi:tetratricopeptide (TPR) repeat protein